MEDRSKYMDCYEESRANRRAANHSEIAHIEENASKKSLQAGIGMGLVDSVPLPVYDREFKEPDLVGTPERKRRLFGTKRI